jgi:hypothetical protein
MSVQFKINLSLYIYIYQQLVFRLLYDKAPLKQGESHQQNVGLRGGWGASDA